MTEEKAKKRGLGRGLGALFGDEEGLYPSVESLPETSSTHKKSTAGIDQLEPGPFQPRQYIAHDALNELAESIAAHGVLQPILVRPKEGAEGRYQIIAGERRWRAAQKAQLHEVPIIVKSMTDEMAMEVGLIENLQREDLNPLEEAQGYQRLIEQFGHTQEQLASALGKSRPHVANMLRLLNLAPHIQNLIRQSKISAGHARALVGVNAQEAEELAKAIIEQGLSVRATETLAAGAQGRTQKKRGGKAGKAAKDVDTLALEQEITNMLGLKVRVDMKGDGMGGRTGTLRIDYNTLDQLDEVLKRLTQNRDRIG